MNLLLLALVITQADPSAYPQVKMKVGEQVTSPVPMATGVNCDDRKIVDVIDLKDHLEFKGLMAGKTLCALGNGKLPPRVLEIVVEPAPVVLPPKKADPVKVVDPVRAAPPPKH